MNTDLSIRLHDLVKEAVGQVRTELGNASIGGFVFHIECSGRTSTGDIRIEYRLATDTTYIGGSSTVEGARLAPVIEEAQRRNRWKSLNLPECLPAPSES